MSRAQDLATFAAHRARFDATATKAAERVFGLLTLFDQKSGNRSTVVLAALAAVASLLNALVLDSKMVVPLDKAWLIALFAAILIAVAVQLVATSTVIFYHLGKINEIRLYPPAHVDTKLRQLLNFTGTAELSLGQPLVQHYMSFLTNVLADRERSFISQKVAYVATLTFALLSVVLMIAFAAAGRYGLAAKP